MDTGVTRPPGILVPIHYRQVGVMNDDGKPVEVSRVKRGEWNLGLNLPGGSQVGKSNTEDMVKTAPPGRIVPVGRLHT